MVWVCDFCKKEQHKKCESKFRCECKCNVDGAADITQKVLATTAGVGVASAGLAITILSFGLALPIGGAMMGAGISSAYQGISKSIKKERINAVSYFADVGFGAVTGVFTSGVGAAGEVVAMNVAKAGAQEFAKAGAKKLIIRTVAGGVAGLSAKAIDEVKLCTTKDKKWSDYGKSFNEDGEENGTAASWLISGAVGGLGGIGSHVSSNCSKVITSGVGKSAMRVGVSGTTAAAGDAAAQFTNIAAGNQEKYDPKRTATSFAVSTITAAAQESGKNTIYKLNGGKENLLIDKANRVSINEKVPKSHRQMVMDGYESMKEIPLSKLDEEALKSFSVTNPRDMKHMNKHNTHFLTGDKAGLMANDVKPDDSIVRGGHRAIFDYDGHGDSQAKFKFSSYIEDHNYKGAQNYGDSDFNEFYKNQENNVKIIKNAINSTLVASVRNEEDDNDKKQAKPVN